MDSDALLAELVRYGAEIANIESRFIRITESLFYIETDDDALIRQRVEQLIEILNDALGVTEWYVIKADLIHEVRAYYQYREDRDCELIGFPYVERGYLLK